MINSVATATTADQALQLRRRRQAQLQNDEARTRRRQSRSPSTSEESALEEEELTIEATQDPRTEAFVDVPVPTRLDPNYDSVRQLRTEPANESEQRRLQAAAEAALAEEDLVAQTPPTASNSVAQHVDHVLQLTNDKFGATLRIQRILADEVVQGVAEAAEESERGESVFGGGRKSTWLGSQDTSENFGRGVANPETVQQVEEVYTHDLFEENPKWASFLISSTSKKVQAWKARRDKASNAWERLIHSDNRMWIYMTLSYPDFSRLAYWTGIFIIAIIVLNTVTFCIESVPHFLELPLYDYLTIVDYVCMAIFTVEYLLRLLCCPDLRSFVLSFSNFIDVVAILPFYIELCVTGTSNGKEAFQTRVVRLLRLLRVLRIVKTMPKLRHLTLVVDTLRTSIDVLVMLGFLLTVLLVLFGTVFYFVEPSTFDSIPEAMYYAQTTLTTTGYGDIYPMTPWGRFAAGASMLLCMVVVSLPIAVIGGNFSEKWADYKSFKAAVDRSTRVCPTVRELKQALVAYEKVLDDVMAKIQEGEEATEKHLATLRHDLASARAHLERGGGGTHTPSGNRGASEGRGWILSVAKSAMRRMKSGGVGSKTESFAITPGAATALGSGGSSGDNNLRNGNGGDAYGSPESAHLVGEEQKELRAAACLAAAAAGDAGITPQRPRRPEGRFRNAVGRIIQDPSGAAAAAGDAAAAALHGTGALAVEVLLEPSSGSADKATPEGSPQQFGRRSRPSTGSAVTTPRRSPSLLVQPPELPVEDPGASTMPPPPTAPPAPAPGPPPIATDDPADPTRSRGAPNPRAAASSSFRAGVLARDVTKSISAFFGGKKGAPSGVGRLAISLSGQQPPAVDPGALAAAAEALSHAADACRRARSVRVKHVTLAALARFLSADDVPDKLERLDDQYRVLRCWQDELGPMAARMWCVRDALDRLAWTLQEGMPEEELKYVPASPEARMEDDDLQGFRRVGAIEEAATGSASDPSRPDGAALVVH